MKRGIWIKIMSWVSGERGLAFMSTLIVSTILGLGALAFIITSSNGAGAVNQQIQAAQAQYSSEAAAAWAMAKLKTDGNWQPTGYFGNSAKTCPKLPGMIIYPEVSFVYSPTATPPYTWGTFVIASKDKGGQTLKKIMLDVSKQGGGGGDVNVPSESLPTFTYAVCSCGKMNPNIALAPHPRHSSNSYKSHRGKYKDHDDHDDEDDDDDKNEHRCGDIDSEDDVEIRGDAANPTVINGNIRCRGNVTLNGKVEVHGDVIAKGTFWIKNGAQVLCKDDKCKKGGGNVNAENGYEDDGYSTNKVAACVNVGKKKTKPTNGHIKGCKDNTYVYSTASNDKKCPCTDKVDLDKAMTYTKSHNHNYKIHDKHPEYLKGLHDDEFELEAGQIYTFEPGVYYFTAFRLNDQTAKVMLGKNNQDPYKRDSDVIIYLDTNKNAEHVKLGKKCGWVKHSFHMEVDSKHSGDDDKYTPNFRIYTNTTGNVDLDSDADEHRGTVYAPYANVHISKKARMKGAVVGKNVDWGDDDDDDEWKADGWTRGCPQRPHPDTETNTNEQVVFDEDTNVKQDLPKNGTEFVGTGNPYAAPKIWREIPLN